jgi:uncharacterized protein YdaU (DUF1376 family)
VASKSDTWMPLYIADYLRKTMHLTRDQHGAYFLLLMACWDRGGRLPNDPGQLAGIARATAFEWRKLAPVILSFFSVEGEYLTQSRVIEEREKAARLSEARRQAGLQGGRPPKPDRGGDGGSKTKPGEKPNGFANGKQTKTPTRVALSSPSQPVEPIGSDTGGAETSVSSLSAGKPSRARASQRLPEEPIPDGYPDAQAQAEAEGWVAGAGVILDVGAQVRRFRDHAATKDRRERNWPGAWKQWIGIACETAPRAPAAATPLQTATWNGPPDVWAAVVAATSDDFARSWLRGVTWQDKPVKALVSASATTIQRLRTEIGPLLDARGISLLEKAA